MVDYIAVFHAPGCGEKLFWAKPESAEDFNPVQAGDIMLLDETIPKDGDPIICGSCGEHLHGHILPTSFYRIISG